MIDKHNNYYGIRLMWNSLNDETKQGNSTHGNYKSKVTGHKTRSEMPCNSIHMIHKY